MIFEPANVLRSPMQSSGTSFTDSTRDATKTGVPACEWLWMTVNIHSLEIWSVNI